MLAFVMLYAFIMHAQTPEQIKKIVSTYDTVALNKLKTKFIAEEKDRAQRVSDTVKLKGWPLTIIGKDSSTQYLWDITPDGKPLYITTFNADASKSTRAVQLNTGGSLGLNLNGHNYTVYIWDLGIARATHQEYDGPGGNNRYSVGDTATWIYPHSTHVAGTIMASGVVAQAKGMAPQSKVIGYEYHNDLSEAATAAGNGMILSSQSYGFAISSYSPLYIGAYQQNSSNWDSLMFIAPYYLEVLAAGNSGTNNISNTRPLGGNANYDKLTSYQTSKNSLVVANGKDAYVDNDGNLLQNDSIYEDNPYESSYGINGSSQGPTDDYRIKPDITGNGFDVYSTYYTTDNSYVTYTGTSMASPNVAGTLLLLQEHANNVFGNLMKAATLKGLALHTADDAGIAGPDAIYGWGLLNAKKAAIAISQTTSPNGLASIIQELNLSQGQTYSFTVTSDAINPLMASISWTDRGGTCLVCSDTTVNNHTPVLVNDLDIRVSNASNTYTPWKLTSVTANAKGDNIVDPYERVDVSGATGTYTVTVSHKGTLAGGSQNYSLIITGLMPHCATDLTISDSPTYNLSPPYSNIYPNITIGTIITNTITATSNQVFKFSNTAVIKGPFSSGTGGNTLSILPTPCQ